MQTALTAMSYPMAPTVNPSAYSYYVQCLAWIEHPHYSSGAGGALQKTRISCTGSGKQYVAVKVGGLVSLRSASTPYAVPGPYVTKAQSNLTQTVAVNGAAKTYYTPGLGSNGGRGTGFWISTSVWQIQPHGTVGSKTMVVWKKI